MAVYGRGIWQKDCDNVAGVVAECYALTDMATLPMDLVSNIVWSNVGYAKPTLGDLLSSS